MTLGGYERASEWPLTGLAVVFVAAYAWPILDPGMPTGLAESLGLLTAFVWVLFGVDYATRLYLAEQRLAFVRAHVLDLVVLAVPVFRPLRALRVVPGLWRLNTRASVSFYGQVATYVVGAVALVLFIAALAVLDAERGDPNANIVHFGDAVWWAFTTLTSVGYGDRFPVTGQGRAVAVGLMLAGIALVGVVTALLASWFVRRLGATGVAEVQTQHDAAELVAEVRQLREELRPPS